MLSNDDMQRIKRLVNLAPLMTQEMQQGLLDLIRKLKAAEAREGGMPASAVQSMVDVIDHSVEYAELVRPIFNLWR